MLITWMNEQKTQVEIVVPCYNEFENIPNLIAKAKEIVELSDSKINFILVNNGSIDNTQSLFGSQKTSGIRYLTSPKNLGYGGGILFGIKATSSRFVGWTHADLQTPLEDLLKFLPYLDSNNIFFKGIRKGRNLIDSFLSFGMGIFESLLFQARIKEVNAQPTIFNRNFLETWTSPPLDFSLDLYALVMARKMNLTVKRIEVIFLQRKFGQSKWNFGIKSRFRFICRTILYSFKLRGKINAYNKTQNQHF